MRIERYLFSFIIISLFADVDLQCYKSKGYIVQCHNQQISVTDLLPKSRYNVIYSRRIYIFQKANQRLREVSKSLIFIVDQIGLEPMASRL